MIKFTCNRAKKPLDQTRYQLVAKMATIVRPPFFFIKIHSHTSICRAHKMNTDSTNSIKLKLKNISLWLFFFVHKNGNQAKQKCAMFYHLASSDNNKKNDAIYIEFRGKIECTRDTSVASSIVVKLHLILRCFFFVLLSLFPSKISTKNREKITSTINSSSSSNSYSTSTCTSWHFYRSKKMRFQKECWTV